MTKHPLTKIIATIGPASWDDEVLLDMIREGLVVARINASFADFEELDRVSTQLRRLSPRTAIMLDTKGHKIRVTGFEKEITLETGQQISLIPSESRTRKDCIKITYQSLHKDIVRGTKILIDDGNIVLIARDIDGDKVVCEILAGGILKTRKTVNVPGVHLNFPKLSQKDQDDIRFAVENKFDLISASFIRNTEDVQLVREIMKDSDAKLIAKIEDVEGVENFDSILEVVDAIMVARGDLGVELPPEKIPILQKQFIYKCRMKGKPVIVATQMLESMRENLRPTRAEVSDVANAIMDGTDAIMLSAESSTGKHPVESVKMMATIATEVEQYMSPQVVTGQTAASVETDTLCRHVDQLSNELKIAGVIVISQTGKTISSLTRHRLNIPIWSISSNPILIRQQQLYRGVTGYYIQDFKKNRDDLIQQAIDIVFGNGHLELTDKVIVISGSTVGRKKTNTILEIVSVSDILDL
ncbi:pyruvate kinase [Candidatus Nomurabacteria bacterium]|nr:pyruvate kinase [Candidatus Nomurabacteria bacterium]